MAPAKADHSRTALRQELELIERFVASYGKQLDAVIDQLNARSDPAAEARSLRLCVEAVGMMLATHGQLASALKRLTAQARTDPQRQSVARSRNESYSAPAARRAA